MNKLVRISPSQIKTFRMCQRKWGWGLLDGLWDDSSEAAELGTATHTALEYRMDKGSWQPAMSKREIRALAIAKSAEHLLPPREDVLGIEQKGKETEPILGLWTYSMILDLVYRDERGLLVVHDHKTTSDYRYAVSPGALRSDVQAIMYAWYAIKKHGEHDEVLLRWMYMLTKDRRHAKMVCDSAKPEWIQAQMESSIFRTAAEIYVAKQFCTTAMQLPGNKDACRAYGGCSKLGKCGFRLSAQQAPEEQMMNLLEKIQARRDAQLAKKSTVEQADPVEKRKEKEEQAPDPIEVVHEQGSINPPETKEMTEEEKRVPPPEEEKPAKKKKAKAKTKAVLEKELAEALEQLEERGKTTGAILGTGKELLDKAYAETKILRTENTRLEEALSGRLQEILDLKEHLKGIRKTSAAGVFAGSAIEALTDENAELKKHVEGYKQAAEQGEGLFEENVRLKKQLKSVEASKEGTRRHDVADLKELTEENARLKKESEDAHRHWSKAVAPETGYTLYIDCIPMNEQFVGAGVCFTQAAALLAQESNLQHYSFAEYGKGRGMFSVALTEVLKDVTGNIYLCSASPEARDALATLEQHAGAIVRGI